jgi:hypothetical protein
MDLSPGVISPQDWGLPVATDLPDNVLDELGVSLADLEARARAPANGCAGSSTKRQARFMGTTGHLTATWSRRKPST